MPKTSFYSGTGITSEKADAVESSANAAAQSAANAATSETNALTSETNAATSAANALTSETNASSSAANALTSETNAATSEANALASATAAQNLEITSASFDTADGTLTLTKANSGTVTTDLDGRFLTSYTETNNLTTAVTWANVPDNFITQSSVTQHQAALSITESQISDLQSYLTSETSHADVLVDGDFTSNGFMKRTGAGTYAIDNNTYLTSEANDLSTSVTWANVPDANITQSSVTQHQGALSITESQISDLQTYLTAETSHADVVVDGDFTSAGIMTTDGSGGYSVDSSTYATETYVDTAVSNLVDSAPATLDTLNELASALGDDANFSTTVTNSIGTKWTEDATKILNWDTAYSWGDHDAVGYLTAETNDLSTTVTWANVPDANITESSVTQHQAALSITESQISDLQTYLTTHQDISGKANLSGATFTGNVNIGLPPSGTQSLTVAGNITANGTVDGVDIAARDAVLTSTTTTANSAMQDLVDDTSPQLGGDLSLNGNDITGTGNISITQTSTSTPALHIYNDDNSAVASPTIRLERKSASTADDDKLGKIEFHGWADGRFYLLPTAEYANITGVVNDASSTGGDIEGQLDFNISRDGTLTTGMSLTDTTLELPNGTDLVVTGTVDGRDVATDGARLDTIPYHRVRDDRLSSFNQQLALTTANQNLGQYQTLYHPSTPVETMRFVDVEWTTLWSYVNSSNNDIRLSLYLTVPSTVSAVSIGTANAFAPSSYYSVRQSNEQWYWVSGNYEYLFTEFGRVSQSNSGSIKQQVLSTMYNPSSDRTYFCATNTTAPIATGDTVYFHPYAWQNANAQLLAYKDIAERYRSGSERHNVSFKLPYTDETLAYKLNVKELSSTDSAIVRDARVRITSTGI